MTKREFLDKLKKALANDLSGNVIRDNVDYYNDYITEEVRKGRKESEVIEELGDPWQLRRISLPRKKSREIRGKHMTAMSRKDREARRMNRAMTRNQDTEECMSSDLIHGGRNWCFFLESLVLSY